MSVGVVGVREQYVDGWIEEWFSALLQDANATVGLNRYCVGQPINTSKVVFLHQYSNNCWQKDPMACFPFGTVEPEEYDNLPKYKYDV